MAAPFDCADCGLTHPRGCHVHVAECPTCVAIYDPPGAKPAERDIARRLRPRDLTVGLPCSTCGTLVIRRPCSNAPARGTTVCVSHGGAASQVAGKGQRREEAATELRLLSVALTDLGFPPDPADAADALLEQLSVRSRAERYLRGRVAELGEVFGSTFHANGTATGDAKPHVLWLMWRDEAKLLAEIAALTLRAGVEERQVRILEQAADELAALLRGVLDDPDFPLAAADREAADAVVYRHLTLLPADRAA